VASKAGLTHLMRARRFVIFFSLFLFAILLLTILLLSRCCRTTARGQVYASPIWLGKPPFLQRKAARSAQGYEIVSAAGAPAS
jgi:hypothetical protein